MCRGYPFSSPSRAVRFAAAIRSPPAARFPPRPVDGAVQTPVTPAHPPVGPKLPGRSGDQPAQVADLRVESQPLAELPAALMSNPFPCRARRPMWRSPRAKSA